MSQKISDLLESFAKQVSDGTFDAYLPRAIPHALDTFVRTVVRSFQESDEDEQALITCLPDQGASVLLAFAERQASLAVAVGLAAAARCDEREGMLVMPVIWHAAAMLRYTSDIYSPPLPERFPAPVSVPFPHSSIASRKIRRSSAWAIARALTRTGFASFARGSAAQPLHRADALRHASHASGRRSCRTLSRTLRARDNGTADGKKP